MAMLSLVLFGDTYMGFQTENVKAALFEETGVWLRKWLFFEIPVCVGVDTGGYDPSVVGIVEKR